MRLSLVLALLSLSAFPSRADDAAPLPKGHPQEARPEPAPQLTHLERTLTQKRAARDKGTLPPVRYQEFVTSFRAELDAVMGRIPPTPENKGLHAQILARLGEQERGHALASLEQAIAEDPENPALLVAKGSILHEQKDYPAAAALAQQAWEASGRTDERAWVLLKMSEGRTGGGQTGEPMPRLRPAADFARLEWSIPENNDISPRAMGFIQQAVAARRKGDMAATMSGAQAAMNADPTSVAVQKLYGLVQADQTKHADTTAFIRQAAESMHAGRGPEAVAWAQKAYDRSPGDDTYGILQDIRSRSAALDAKHGTKPSKAPKGGLPLWPAGAILGLTAIGYGVARSKGTWTEQESEKLADEDPNSERIQRNRYHLKVATVSAAIGFGIVYGVPWVIATGAPAAIKFIRDSGGSLQRVVTSESGAINPNSANLTQNAAKTAIWSAGRVGDPARNALGHWNKHRVEFPEFRNAKEYVEGAWRFIRSPPPGTLSKPSSVRAGETVFYNPTSNTLVIRGVDGAPKSMYRPDIAINKFATNMDYYNAQ